MKMMADDELIAALRAADPAALTTVSDSDALLAVRRARPERRRPRWAMIAAAIAAVIVVGVPAGAAATGFMAQTGWFGSPNPGDHRDRCIDGGVTEYDCDDEWIDLSAPDLDEVVASVYPTWMPLAPGVTREDLTARVVTISSRDALTPVTSLRRAYESESYKDWLTAWIAANDGGDTAAQETASRVIAEAAGWPALVATDGGGITDIMRAFAERIAAGDREAAQAAAEYEQAPGWDGVERRELVDEVFDEVFGDDR
ncbi:hypothetical protein [Microbacterium sp. cf332]|uniref:hypothetical protein n=1 Tax=Microbacterium sp. cf332 TaxID=1761804 RepID=UPI0008820AF3|nr:hypothetical protein [Microbacterium sp. cf332]SDQ55087.1 hypothetical protein SAMN04487847_1815 [Microbacterium sp. cf332]